MDAVGKRRLGGLALAALVFAADQWLKWYLVSRMWIAYREVIPVVSWFDFRFARNYGVSFSFLQATSPEMRWLLVLLTMGIAAGVLFWMLREKAWGEIGALGLVLGGALGNIWDRARDGYVTDYADLHFGEFRPFAIFNLADAAISIGVVIILARSFLSREKPEPGTARPEPDQPASGTPSEN